MAQSLLLVPGWTPERLRAFADRYATEVMNRQSAPRAKELAARLGMSASECATLFWHILSEQPGRYLRKLQLARAKELLSHTNDTMNDIAYGCGFGTRTTFFRTFKRETGLTPKQYRSRTSNG
jgi:AraC-like DNA-binding protein